MSVKSPAFFVRDIPVYGDLILSPMDGYSDLPFRSLCRSLGSAMSYTEFINVLDILQGHPHVHEKYAFLTEERPMVFQVFDSDPQRILEVALRLQDQGPDIIDINMGCSANRVSGRGAGAGLLREPHKIARIFSTLSAALHVPVTGKIRLGWDDSHRNYVQVARLIEDNGGRLIAVHARTKAQGYSGQADWDAIAEIKAQVKIPVLGNGDVRTPADIERLKAHTDCDGIMVGRAAIGNPWIFSRLERKAVPVETVERTLQDHLQRSLAFYGPQRGLILFRKHAHKYLSLYPLDPVIRQRLLTATQVGAFTDILQDVYRSLLPVNQN